MVVSEIGEQWSPHTAPARQAEMQMMTIDGISPVCETFASSASNTLVTIGISMPNVPHDVPVAKASPIATTNSITGRSTLSAVALCTTPETNAPASRWFVIVLSVHAKVSISIAGTICLNPAAIESIHSLNFSTRRSI